jgi:hypothetical protein
MPEVAESLFAENVPIPDEVNQVTGGLTTGLSRVTVSFGGQFLPHAAAEEFSWEACGFAQSATV